MQAELDLPQLCQAMQRARLQLRRYREERTEMVREFVGRHWSEQGARDRVPVNLISLYVQIVGRNLIAKNPRLMLSTFNRSQKPIVSAMQDWANKEIEDTALVGTLQRIVTDALFSIGICKVALATPADAASMAWNLNAGQPFAESVDLDDFVFDMHAKDFAQVGFMGHRIRVPLSAVKDSRLYSKERKDLAASTDPLYNQEGDERVSTLGRGFLGDSEEYEQHVDLWEVYLPRHRQVLTLAEDSLTGATHGKKMEPLRVQSWLGPDKGPYHILAYGVVPGNAMPKAPIMDLMDLHEAVNRVFRKLIRTLDRIKENTLYQTGGSEDADRIKAASDGDMIAVANPDKIKQMVFSGQHVQILQVMGTALKDLFSWVAGNLDIMGGLSPQSKTATQDKMLDANSNRAIADMQDRTINFTSGVLKALCWYWHHDPFKAQQSLYSLPGLPEMQVLRRITPEMRQQGRFEDLEIRVDPYSMQHDTPESRVKDLDQLVSQIITPMLPILEQHGIGFDLNAYLRKRGQYKNMPDLNEIVTIQEAVPQESSSDKPAMPAQTQRTYTRENMPGRTRQGDDMNRSNTLLGIDEGGAQKNGLMGVGA